MENDLYTSYFLSLHADKIQPAIRMVLARAPGLQGGKWCRVYCLCQEARGAVWLDACGQWIRWLETRARLKIQTTSAWDSRERESKSERDIVFFHFSKASTQTTPQIRNIQSYLICPIWIYAAGTRCWYLNTKDVFLTSKILSQQLRGKGDCFLHGLHRNMVGVS